MSEKDTLIKAITEKKQVVAMLAPSFPIVFPYPAIITMLRKIGFTYVVEVSLGARKTNEQLHALLQQNPNGRYITSPCPSIVRMVRTQMPQFEKYFPNDVDSPMVATAKIVLEKYPGYQPVFIGPCNVKRLEAKEDYPELNILAVTYSDIQEIFKLFNLEMLQDTVDQFDLSEPGLTRIYPLDGGLAYSSGVLQTYEKGKVKVVSGWKQCKKAIEDFDINQDVKLMDILFCDGGCINGPGIQSSFNTEQRRKIIASYYMHNRNQ